MRARYSIGTGKNSNTTPIRKHISTESIETTNMRLKPSPLKNWLKQQRNIEESQNDKYILAEDNF